MIDRTHVGDVRELVPKLLAAGVRAQCIVTSPPYWGLRDYGTEPLVWGGLPDCAHAWGEQATVHKGGSVGSTSGLTNRGAHQERNAVKQFAAGSCCERCGAWLGSLGLEPTPYLYVEHLADVLDLCGQLLTPDGVLWLNLGDCYATGAGAVGRHPGGGFQGRAWASEVGPMTQPNRLPIPGLKPKDLVGAPWRVAFELQARGWWLRSDCIWSKPNPMPESIADRPTKAHEYVFLLARSERYHYDAAAIAEPALYADEARWDPGTDGLGGGDRKVGASTRRFAGDGRTRNKRTVWTIPTTPFAGAHFATFPRDLAATCVLAGSRPGDVVFDPFMGSGTVGEVALALGRHYVGTELNAKYAALGETARSRELGLPL